MQLQDLLSRLIYTTGLTLTIQDKWECILGIYRRRAKNQSWVKVNPKYTNINELLEKTVIEITVTEKSIYVMIDTQD